MKIRTVIMLVAGSALAVPQIARAQDVYPRVEAATYWWRWTREGANPAQTISQRMNTGTKCPTVPRS
jgi:hypothetical protein